MTVGGRDFDDSQDDGLPSVEMTMRFLALCEQYGSHEAAVEAIAAGRQAGVPGLPDRNWPEWNAAAMRAAVEYLEGTGAAVPVSRAPRRQRR